MTQDSAADGRHVKTPPEFVLVIGTGRSGTHWLAHVLRSHARFRVTFERFPMFQLATRMAVDQRLRPALFPLLVLSYRVQRLASGDRIYADKSHPAIWLAERLAAALPSAVFLGVQREPFATVCSMMRRDGVRAWHERWRRYPVPNEFLGITPEIAPHYASLSLAARCALRWRAHRDRMESLKPLLGHRLHVVGYEELARDPDRELSLLQDWLGLDTPFDRPRVDRDALQRWRTQLSDRDVADISAVVA
jgi:LPS sulfotransferase NodH